MLFDLVRLETFGNSLKARKDSITFRGELQQRYSNYELSFPQDPGPIQYAASPPFCHLGVHQIR